MNTYGYDINIKEVLNGYVVTIGCQTVVIEGRKSLDEAIGRLTEQLHAYLRDKQAVQNAWTECFKGGDRVEAVAEIPYVNECPPTTTSA